MGTTHPGQPPPLPRSHQSLGLGNRDRLAPCLDEDLGDEVEFDMAGQRSQLGPAVQGGVRAQQLPVGRRIHARHSRTMAWELGDVAGTAEMSEPGCGNASAERD